MPRDVDRFVFVVGADKCGSTWLWQYFRDHPDVHVPNTKELFYFVDQPRCSPSAYHRELFRGRGAESVVADVCHDYLYSSSSALRIAEFTRGADTSILLLVRNPVDRAVSAYRYMRSQGRTELPFSVALREIDELIDHASYSSYIEPYISTFKAENVTILDFAVLADGCWPSILEREIGVSAVVAPTEQINPARRARSGRAVAAGRRLAAGLRRLGLFSFANSIKQSDVVESLFFESSPPPSVEVTAADREYVRERLFDDARRLDGIFDSDFASAWFSAKEHSASDSM